MQANLPFFSIIVPTNARPMPLSACLEALANLTYPHDRFEVIVVDDGSATPPDPLVSSFQSRCNVRLLRQSHAGPGAARNTGAQHAKGQYLAFTDDDCAPRPEWLTALSAQFARCPDHAIGGRTMNGCEDNLYSTASQVLVDYLYEYYIGQAKDGRFFTSNNLAVSRAQFQAIGGFDPRFPRAAAEDRDFCDRWLSYGFHMTYEPDARVRHSHVLTLSRFSRQHFNYGCGAFSYHQARALRCNRIVTPEPLSFYVNLMRYPLSLPRTSGSAVILCALLVLSQVCNAVGFVWNGIQERGSR